MLGLRLLCLIYCFSFFTFSQSGTSSELDAGVQKSIDSLKKLEGEYWSKGDALNNIFVRHELVTNYAAYLDEDAKATWYTKMAESYIHYGNYLLAIEFLNKSLTYKNERVDAYSEARIGSCYIELEQLDSAKVHYQLAINKSETDDKRMPHINSLGFVYFLNSEYDAAEKTFLSALDLFSGSGQIDSIQYYIVKSNMASLYFAQQRDKEGENALREIEGWQRYNDVGDWFRIEVSSKFASYYMSKGLCQQADSYLMRLDAMMTSAEINEGYLSYLELKLNRIKQCGIYDGVKKLISDYIEAQEKWRIETRNRLLVVEKLQRNALMARLSLAATNLELKSDSEELLELSNSRLKRLFYISGISVLGFAAVFVFWFRQRNKRHKRKEEFVAMRHNLVAEQEKTAALKLEMAEKNLENKKLELVNMFNSADSSSALFEEIESRLKRLKNKKSGEISEDVNQLVQFVKSHSKSLEINSLIEKNSDLFSVKLKERIEEQYPDLTKSELQLIILIRLGLSTKEMAQLKNVEPSSIRIFKHRLKTKLKVSKGTDLTDFISQI